MWKVPPERIDSRKYYEARLYNLGKAELRIRPSSASLQNSERLEAILNGSLVPDFDTFFEQAKSKGFFIQRKNAYSLNQSLLGKYIQYLEKGGTELAPIIRNKPAIVNKLFSGKMFPYNPHNFVFLTDFFRSLSTIKARNDFKEVTCCNKLCSHFEKPIPRENYELLRVEYKKKMGAKVRCPFCGIEFLMSIEPNSKHLMIREYGALTRKIAQTRIKEGISFRQIQLELDISKSRLKSIYFSSGNTVAKYNHNSSVLLNQRRALWTKELHSKRFVSLAKSKDKLYAIYRWLQKNDPAWTKQINRQFRAYPKGRPKTGLTKAEDITAFKKKLTNIREDALKKQIPRRISITFLKINLSKRERTILESSAKLKSYCQSLTENQFEFKLRRIDYFLHENPELSFSKSFLFAKFKIPHSIDGLRKDLLQTRLKNLTL